jgi:sigma-B regulation protein RsbU (phosphoserine phosphatase)
MKDNKGLFFTIWYGVYKKSSRQIYYSSGGHPPAILLTGNTADTANMRELRTPSLFIGGLPEASYQSAKCKLENFNKLIFYSDGAYEVFKPDNTLLDFDKFLEQLTKPTDPEASRIEKILDYIYDYQGSKVLEDDFSMVEVVFK